MNIKQEFSIFILHDIYSFIEMKGQQEFPTHTNYEEIKKYAHLLKNTKLTESIFQEGGLFDGFKENSAGYDMEYSNGTHTVSFDGLHCVYCGEKETYPVIQTLADLARLTAKHPLKLR